jgi:Transcriptional regulator
MRIVKEAEERRNEILDAAEKLFSQKGFEGTSTNDILDKVGIARGTLYYHFKSKEDIMDALIDRYNISLLSSAKAIAADQSLSVKERLLHVIISLNISNQSGKEIIEHIHKPQNALMHQKIQKVLINGITPILSEIIREGVEQKIFDTPFPYECMEMIMIYANSIFDDDIVALSDEERMGRIQAFVFNTERLLGAQSGSFMEVMIMLNENTGGSNE